MLSKYMKNNNKNFQYSSFGAICAVMLLFAVSIQPLPGYAAEKAEVWGEDTNVLQYERFYIAGQPDEVALQEADQNGVSVVISLRSESELDWDEKAVSESMGQAFYQVPVNSRSDNLAPGPFDQITEIVAANPDAKIMVHCGSGNRAAAWLAVYLSEEEGMAPDEAIAVARENGLTNKGLEDKVRTYLNP